MAAFVVDTNVPIVANRRSHADPVCVNTCVDTLLEVRSGGIVVLDEGMRILDEYMNHLSLSGEPGAGDLFMKWVWTVQADERLCERVALTPLHGPNSDAFAEFPDDPDLANFDMSDRKFVAVAIASQNNPVVLNAVDSDWAECHQALRRNGVTVRFLCPQHVAPE